MTNRETVLSQINEILAQRNLRSLLKLGDIEQGEFEIVGIKEIFDHSKNYFTDIKFGAKLPNGKPAEFTVRFNANGAVSDGSVVVVLINGKFGITKQWRLPLGRYTYEVPRGFGAKMEAAHANGELNKLTVSDMPLATLTRELGADVMASAQVLSVTHLGDIYENTGTSNVIPSYFLVQLTIDEDKLPTKENGLVTKLWNFAEVKNQLGGKLKDNHTITAIALAQKTIEALSQIV